MFQSRTPITDANIAAHEAAAIAGLTGAAAADDTQMPAARRKPQRGSAILARMADHMLEHPGCTGDDLRREGFSQRDIELYGQAAAERAKARSGLN